MMNFFHAFMQEGLHVNPLPGSSNGLHVGPVSNKKTPGSLVEYSVDVLSSQIVQSTRHASGKEKEAVKIWMSDLPTAMRTSIMQHMFKYKQKPDTVSQSTAVDLTRSEYFHVLESSFAVLYSPDWTELEIPDLHRILQSRGDIKIDSPNTVEDVERVLLRLGITPSASNSTLTSPTVTRDPSCHMTHADVYSAIFDTVINGGQSYTKVLQLHAYMNRNVYSIREKQRILDMVGLMPRLLVLEIGNAADDSILWQVGQTCLGLKKLSIAGNEVTDRGIYWLCGQKYEGDIPDNGMPCPVRFHDQYEMRPAGDLDRTPLCKTMTHLSMAGSLMVTEEGLKKCWTTFQNLVHFHMQESHMWLLLKRIRKSKQYEEYKIPIRQLELTTSAKHDYLTPAGWVFPKLEDLTLWNFEPENTSSFTSFANWENFSCLHTLKLNNVSFKDLYRILEKIGSQLKLIDLDNFSIEETPSTCVDVVQVAEMCPNIVDLSLTMAHIDCNLPKEHTKLIIFPNLEHLTLKGATFQSVDVFFNILLQTPNLVSLTFFHKLNDIHPNRIPSQEPINDQKLAEIFKRNPLRKIQEVNITAIDHEFGPLLLTEESLFLLISSCPKLVKVGNLSKWLIEDIDRTMCVLNGIVCWGRVKS